MQASAGQLASCRRNAAIKKERCAAATTRRCIRCEQELPKTLEFFYSAKGQGGGGLSYRCKRCANELAQAYRTTPKYRKHLERTREHRRDLRRRKRTEPQPIEVVIAEKRRKAKRLPGLQGDALRGIRLARQAQPERHKCCDCKNKAPKTRLFFPFGPILWTFARRLCLDCWGKAYAPQSRARAKFAHLFVTSDEDRAEWNEIHAERLARKAAFDEALAKKRAELDALVAEQRIVADDVPRLLLHWECYEAPELCSA